jgi:hypothetical protein
LQKATESLNCNIFFFLNFFDTTNDIFLIPSPPLLCTVIALSLSEENQCVHERVNALTNLACFDEVFWRNQSKAATATKFQDRMHQMHPFFDKCYTGLKMIWKTMFPLNETPPTLLTLMSKFSNVKKVQSLIRAQVIAGAETAFALLLSRHPSTDLMAIANADGNVVHLFAKAKISADIAIERLEDSSKADDGAQNPEELS